MPNGHDADARQASQLPPSVPPSAVSDKGKKPAQRKPCRLLSQAGKGLD